MKFTLYARRCDPQFYIKNIQEPISRAYSITFKTIICSSQWIIPLVRGEHHYVSMASERVVIHQHELASDSNRVAAESQWQQIDFDRLSNSRGFNIDWIGIVKFHREKKFFSVHQRRVTFFLEFIPLRNVLALLD